jgi:hypothetical protein
MNLTDMLFRIIIGMIFAVISTLFLSFGFLALRKKSDIKKNMKISAIFALLLLIFSFFSNTYWTIFSAAFTLVTIKYIYIRHWKETLAVWGAWNALWILLMLFISLVIYITKPFPAVI